MSWEFTPYLVVVILAAALCAGLSVYVWQRRAHFAAKYLFGLMFSAAIWCGIYAIEIAAADANANLFWNRFKYFGIVFVPVAWLFFSLGFAGFGRLITRATVTLALIFPTITLTIIWGYDFLFWSEKAFIEGEAFNYLDLSYGSWFWVHTGYSYLCLLIGTFIVVRHYFMEKGVQRSQAGIVLAGSMFPFLANAISISPLNPNPALDFTPVAFSMSSLLFSWALYRFQLLSMEFPETEFQMNVNLQVAEINRAARQRTQSLMLWGTVALAAMSLVPFATYLFNKSQPNWLPISLLGLNYLLLVVVSVFPNMLSRWRSFGILWILYIFGLGHIWLFGFELLAGIFLMLFVISTLLLFEVNEAVTSLVVSLMTVFIFGGLVLAGQIVPDPILGVGGSFEEILVGGIAFIIVGGMLVWTQSFSQNYTYQLIERSQNLAIDLNAQRTLLQSRVAQRTKALEASYSASRQIASVVELDQMTHQVADIIQDAFNYYHVQIYLLDHAHQKLTLVGATGLAGKTLLAERHEIAVHDDGVVGQAVMSSARINVPNVYQEPRWKFHELLTRARSAVALPIIMDGEVLGAMHVLDVQINGINSDEIDLLETIAGQIGVGLKNMLNYQESQRKAEQEELLLQVIQRIRQTTDVESAMRVAAETIGNVLNAKQTTVQLEPLGEMNGQLANRRVG